MKQDNNESSNRHSTSTFKEKWFTCCKHKLKGTELQSVFGTLNIIVIGSLSLTDKIPVV